MKKGDKIVVLERQDGYSENRSMAEKVGVTKFSMYENSITGDLGTIEKVVKNPTKPDAPKIVVFKPDKSKSIHIIMDIDKVKPFKPISDKPRKYVKGQEYIVEYPFYHDHQLFNVGMIAEVTSIGSHTMEMLFQKTPKTGEYSWWILPKVADERMKLIIYKKVRMAL